MYYDHILEKFHLTGKIMAVCGDNCNKNFGGAGRKGTNYVFSKPKTSLQLNICGVCCAAHILHNGLHYSAVILSIDIRSIVNKILQYPHIYTVRVEELKLSIHLWKLSMNKYLVVQKLSDFH